MGYYAKDGSYVHDDSDIQRAEVANETQGQEFDRKQRITAQAEAYEAEQKRNADAMRRQNAEIKNEAFQAQNLRAQKAMKQMEEKLEQERREENLSRYGVSYSLRNPKDLEERRSRANFWRLNSNFGILVDTVLGKNQMFQKLWDKFEKSESEEERRQIVEKMEKLYPTTELAIQSVEKKTGYRR